MSKVYLIPSLLDDEASHTIPAYVVDAVKNCQVFFVENERTARRYLKKLWKDIIIDNYQWIVIGETAERVKFDFKEKIKEGKNVGIISEAGCPGVADPGQELIEIAHKMNAEVKPLVGPSSILLALIASGMNGQRFQFVGYLPIREDERIRTIKELEAESHEKNCTQVFIETPYRNNQLISAILKTCKPATKFCIAVDLTGTHEWVKTRTIADWKKEKVDLHKRPAIFLIFAA